MTFPGFRRPITIAGTDGIMKGCLFATIWAFILLAPVVAAAPAIDDARAAAAGLHKLPGKRLTLYTDVTGEEIDRLPAIFEQAFPQWCKYLHISESEHANWQIGLSDEGQGPIRRCGPVPQRPASIQTRLFHGLSALAF